MTEDSPPQSSPNPRPGETTSLDVWRAAWGTLRQSRRQVCLLAGLGVFLPHLFFGWYLDGRSVETAAAVRTLVENAFRESLDMSLLLTPAMTYLGESLFWGLVVFFVAASSFFGLVHVAVGALRGDSPAAGPAFRGGFRYAFPRGLFLALCLFAIGMLGQVLVAPAVILSVLGLMAPAIWGIEDKGVVASVGDALTLGFARRSERNTWSVFFTLLTFGGLFYVIVIGASLLARFILYLDQWLGFENTFWATSFSGSPLGPVYLFASFVQLVVVVAAVSVIPAITVNLYFCVVGQRKVAEV